MTKLTNKAIRSFTYDGGWDVRWDSEITGLGLRVYPSEKKAFVLSFRAGGRKRLMVLGPFGVLTVEQARDMARKHLVSVREGQDPLEAKRREAEGETFGHLIEVYIERHAKAHKKSWREDARRLTQHIPTAWRSRRTDAITRADVTSLHTKIGAEHPYEANRLLSLLHLMFRLAGQWGLLKEGKANPASDIKKFKETKRKRWVHPEELPALARAVDNEQNIYVRAALWLYLLTGLRKTELLQARWADIDWDRKQLRLPDTKAGEEQSIALSAPAIAILQATPELPENPHILPGARKGQHLVNIAKPWGRIRATAGLHDVRLHDLRRSVGSWLSESGIDLNTIKDALRHADIGTTLIYARLSADPAREAMEAHGKRIMEIAGRQRLVDSGVEKA